MMRPWPSVIQSRIDAQGGEVTILPPTMENQVDKKINGNWGYIGAI